MASPITDYSHGRTADDCGSRGVSGGSQSQPRSTSGGAGMVPATVAEHVNHADNAGTVVSPDSRERSIRLASCGPLDHVGAVQRGLMRCPHCGYQLQRLVVDGDGWVRMVMCGTLGSFELGDDTP